MGVRAYALRHDREGVEFMSPDGSESTRKIDRAPHEASPGVRFEVGLYPIIVLRIPSTGDVDGISAWYEETERLLREARSPIALVHDLRAVGLSALTSANRRAVAERSRRLTELSGIELLVADARIVSNQLAVSAMTGVAWLAGKVPWAQSTFTSETEALGWASERIAAAEAARIHAP